MPKTVKETKSKAGRPALYNDATTLEARINEYFRLLKVEPEEKIDKDHLDFGSPTITGLVYFLGFSDRHSFYDYEKREGFSHTIKRARMRIENWYEQGLKSKSNSGYIFALKNFGWQDKTETHITGEPQVTKLEIEYVGKKS